MRRQLLRLVAALSLLLCMATCVLWVRSYWVCSTLMATGQVMSWRGHVEIEWENVWFCPTAGPHNRDDSWSKPELALLKLEPRRPLTLREQHDGGSMIDPGPLGFAYRPSSYEMEQNAGYFDTEMRIWIVPDWFIVGLFAILPFLSLVAAMRDRRCKVRA